MNDGGGLWEGGLHAAPLMFGMAVGHFGTSVKGNVMQLNTMLYAGINTDGIKVGSNADMLSPFKDLSAEQVRAPECSAEQVRGIEWSGAGEGP